eukprot:691774-Amorphochlora_amoeboformis.AAC.1
MYICTYIKGKFIRENGNEEDKKECGNDLEEVKETGSARVLWASYVQCCNASFGEEKGEIIFKDRVALRKTYHINMRTL